MTKTAVITGAGKGLGFAFCKQFLSEGYTVCALDKVPTDELYALESENPNVKVFKVDITNSEEIAKCKEEVEKTYGSIDLLINNAAVWLDKERRNVEEDGFEKEIDLCYTEFDINTMGPLRMIHQFLPLLKAGTSENRAIVNISTDCASYKASTNFRNSEFAYCISKAGVNVISNLISNHLADTDIKVFAVFPGWMQTDMGFAGVTDANITPDVKPAESAECISKLIKGNALPYTYCDRFGNEMV